jgi:ATP-dependent DNA helicase RecG
VGAGKTEVALFSALIAIQNGFQTVLMAPTEILATQHYEKLTKRLEILGKKAAFPP